MRLSLISKRIRGIGLIPMCLVFVLVLRVAAAPAVQCQHALAAEAASTANLATGVLYEPGDLCGLRPAENAKDTDNGGLSTNCPFFMAPAMVPDTTAALEPRYQEFSRNRPIPGATLVAEGPDMAGYNSRAPPAPIVA